MVAATPPAERRRELGVGAGGDRTVVIDQHAEEIVQEELDALHAAGGRFTLVSEELGTRDYGDPGTLVVVDPIDGSLNAKRGLPAYATSIAIAEGPTMLDVVLGAVRDHGTGEHLTAARGAGAWMDGVPLQRLAPASWLELVAIEGAKPQRVERFARALPNADRLRALGSLALSLTSVATGRVDGMVGLRPGRAVDTAAAQLIAREAGATLGMPRVEDLASVPLDVTSLHSVVAAAGEGAYDTLLAALEAARG
jgi:myo-inositol-1(or 4)-monophosphatase